MNVLEQTASPHLQKSSSSGIGKRILVLLALSGILWWNPLIADLRLALSNDAYTYILLIIPLSVSLIYVEGRGRQLPSQPNQLWGISLLSVALLTRAATGWNLWHWSASENLCLSMVALVTWWIGSIILCFGRETFRSLLFPICFLFLIVPLPDRALNWITLFLQQQSASSASMLFGLVGVPVTQDGIILSIPGLTIEVARECSSIRSSTILVVMTVLLAHLFLRSGWRQAVLVLASIPLSVAKNAIRIFTIAELGTKVNPSLLHGRLHEHGGVIFLGLAVLMVLVLLWILKTSEKAPTVLAN